MDGVATECKVFCDMDGNLLRAYDAKDGFAVLEAYGFPKDATESEIVARLFKMYQELTNN